MSRAFRRRPALILLLALAGSQAACTRLVLVPASAGRDLAAVDLHDGRRVHFDPDHQARFDGSNVVVTRRRTGTTLRRIPAEDVRACYTRELAPVRTTILAGAAVFLLWATLENCCAGPPTSGAY